MTERDREDFAFEMAMLAEVFGEPLSEARLAIYFEDLSIYDWEHVRAGIRLARATKKFFPKIADIAECIDEAVEARVQRHAAQSRGQFALPGDQRGQLRSAGDLLRLPPKPE